MKSDSAFSEVPELLTAFAPEFRTEHYHLHGRNIENWESFKSIFLDEHSSGNCLARKILKGAFVGLTFGYIARNALWRGPKAIEMDRLFLKRQRSTAIRSYRGYTAFGAVMGGVWWLIKDVICLPHGHDTYSRQLMAYALMGGVVVSTVYHPVNFIHGFVAGGMFGGLYISAKMYSLPRNFELKLTNTNPEKRAKLLREDEEYELSNRNFLTIKTNLYPL